MKLGHVGICSRYLFNERVKAIRPFLRNGNLLEVGCGCWNLLPFINDNKQYYGIDIEPETIKIVSQQYQNTNLKLCNIEESLDFFNHIQFDNIVMLAVIEHLISPKETIHKLAKRLKKRGVIILTTPAPIGDIILKAGSKIGLFDSAAEEEHNLLLNKKKLFDLVTHTKLKVLKYKRFCFGLNQLIVYTSYG